MPACPAALQKGSAAITVEQEHMLPTADQHMWPGLLIKRLTADGRPATALLMLEVLDTDADALLEVGNRAGSRLLRRFNCFIPHPTAVPSPFTFPLLASPYFAGKLCVRLQRL
jgi:hypothetical protein